jgi:Tol biopolymer transport system component
VNTALIRILAVAFTGCAFGCDIPTAPPHSAAAPTLLSTVLGADSRIAFHSDRDGNLEIYLMKSDGSAQTRLTDHRASDAFPALSADGQKVAFQSDRDGMAPEIYAMNADGSGLARLTVNGAFDGGPVWSPDGRRIAFATGRDGNGEIYVMNDDGTLQTNLTNTPADHESEAQWAPDGQRLTFVSTPSDCCTFTIYMMNADGSGRTAITQGLDPAWSPDGARLAFFRDADLWLMNADGSGQTQLTHTGTYDRSPTWSPDGRKIAFESPRAGFGAEDIYVIDVDGSNETRLTTVGALDRAPNWGTPRGLATAVSIDIHPGSSPNSINCRDAQGVVPVALLTAGGFDATDADIATVTFGPAQATETHTNRKGVVRHESDVDRDGDADLVFHFSFDATGLSCQDDEGVLRGRTTDGTEFTGRDAIRMVHP